MLYKKIVAVDLDGTLFDSHSQISEENFNTIRRATDAGVAVVLSTGRPLCGIPMHQFEGSGVDYAIATNGSSIYRLSTGECLLEEALADDVVMPIIDFLLTRDVHFAAFIGGKGYVPVKCNEAGEKIPLPPEMKKYAIDSRIRVDDLCAFIKDNGLHVQKITINFYPDGHGGFVDREDVKEYLTSNPKLSCVSGGYNNLEFTRSDVSKGVALRSLAGMLGVDMKDTIAIGDTENDLSIIEAAAVGVAMGNSTPAVIAAADYVTLDNDHSGVAAAIRRFCDIE